MNGPVVNVRREPHDDDNPGVTDETDFSASQVASGALEDWVNGKQETTLPADVATAAAAFSLRKVRDSYAGNAVRIRRSSDNIEVNVGFDSEDKVSASSPISNVVESSSSSDVSSTTLGEFVNGTDAFVHTWYDQTEDTTVTGNEYTSSFGSGDFDGFGDNALQNSARENPVQGLGGFDGFALHLKADSSGSSFQIGGLSGRSYSAGDGLRFKLGLYMPSTNTDLRKIKVYTDATNGSSRTMGGEYLRPALDQWVDYEFTDVAESNFIGFRFVQDDGTLGQCAEGDEVYVRLIVIDAITKGGDNAIEETVANQPKIATSGSVLDHINFDGNTFLNIGTNLMDATDGTTSMVMSNIDIDIQTFYISNRGGNNGFNLFNDTGAGEKGKFKYAFVGSGASLISNTFVSDNSDDKFLVTFTKDSNDREFFGNGAVLADDGASNTYTSAGATNTSIGKQGNSSTASGSKLMRVYEIISYNSDQTANRFKIESNINNYYSLYNDEVNFTSVVSPGTLTSTITKSDGTTESANTFQTVTTNSKNSIKYSYDADQHGTGNVFTRYMLDSSSDFIGLAEDDTIEVSLFVEEVPSDSAFRLKLILNDNYTALSDEADISTVGFHSVTLTRNSTSGTADNLQFKSLGVDDIVTISIKDIKASRIARNGFVETWYDQSGSGNDATQGTATNQPAIIKNGGLVTVNSKPAIKFDGTDNYLIIDSELKFNSSASDKANTIFNVAYIVSGNRSYMGLGSGTFNWFGVPYLSNYQYRDNGGNIINTGDAVPLNQQISFTFVSDESNDIETYQNGTSIHSDSSTFATHMRIKNIGRSYNGVNYNEMSSQEIVFFADDKTSDITDLHNEINNYYGI
jgi:hypothetical protein